MGRLYLNDPWEINLSPRNVLFLVGVTQKFFPEKQTVVLNITDRTSLSVETYLWTSAPIPQSEAGRVTKPSKMGRRNSMAPMQEECGEGVIFDLDAQVPHNVFEYRTDPKRMLNRVFCQGNSKRAMEKINPQ